jgi:hypothetical protein
MRYHVTVRPSDLALEAKNAELRREPRGREGLRRAKNGDGNPLDGPPWTAARLSSCKDGINM